MPVHLYLITIKATCVALLSMGVTLLAANVATAFFGGSVSGTGLLLCILCPLVIAGPGSAWQFHQQALLKSAHDQLDAAKASLEQAHAALQQAYCHLDERARRDGLTGILNREGFMSALVEALAAGHGTLLMLDVDKFKQINDRYGHPIGDEALRELAKTVGMHLDDTDIFGRIGGEEFAVFKPGIHGQAALETAERIRLAVRMTPVAVHSRAPLYLSISIGGADSRDFADPDSLWRIADTRLYAAKTGGRDRLVLDETPPAGSVPVLSIG